MSRPRLSAWYPPPIRHRPWTTHRMQSSVRSIGAKRCGTANTAAPSSRFHRSKLRHQGPSFLLRHLRHVHRRRHQLQARRRRLWRALRSDLEGSENVARQQGLPAFFRAVTSSVPAWACLITSSTFGFVSGPKAARIIPNLPGMDSGAGARWTQQIAPRRARRRGRGLPRASWPGPVTNERA